jgi:TonB family protein
MTLQLWLMDLVNYSAQIAAVITVGSLLPFLLRVRRPGTMLVYRQILLAACLLLPLLQPWKRPPIPSSGGVSVSSTIVSTAAAPDSRRPTIEESAAFLLAAGALIRLGWLMIGLVRLRRHRLSAEPLTPLPRVFEDLQSRLGVWPSIALSAEVPGPVTFGIRNTVILLPLHFHDLPQGAQRAIACHEMAHIRRGDWAFTIVEEIIRAVFWFHPCVWWLLGQIQLTREQAVDCEVIAITASREQYIDALLAVAGGRPQPDLAPAPLFLQKSHLSQRVALILKGVTMSRQRLLSSLATIGGALLVTARMAVLYFPISAPAQEVIRGENNLLHRAPIEYPAEARVKGIEGTVIVEVKLNERGIVTDARVVNGPEPLRKAALRSVLDWHYSGQAQSPVEVAIDFKLPTNPAGVVGGVPGGVVGGVIGGVRGGVVGGVPGAVAFEAGRLNRIQFTGTPSQLRDTVAGRLPLRVGDEVQSDTLARIRQALQDIDEHLDARLSRMMNTDGSKEYALLIFSTAPMATQDAVSGGPQRIRVGGNVQAAQLLSGPKPAYPPLAKQARIQGVVKLNVIVGKDGTVQNLELVSGDPLLVDTAMDAVRQWVYKPTLLNGQPVEVVTVVDVNFTLSQ